MRRVITPHQRCNTEVFFGRGLSSPQSVINSGCDKPTLQSWENTVLGVENKERMQKETVGGNGVRGRRSSSTRVVRLAGGVS